MWRIVRPRLAGKSEEDGAFGEPSFAMWPFEPQQAECPNCAGPVPRPGRIQPLAVEWYSWDPLKLGDFTWVNGTSWPLLASELAAELRERFGGFELGPVEVSERRIRGSDMKPGAKLPEPFLRQARELVEMWVTKECEPMPGSAISQPVPPCPSCGLTIMVWGGKSSPGLDVLLKGKKGVTVVERVRVSAGELRDTGFFGLAGSSGKFLLCTDDAKAELEERGTTNVALLEAGELVP